MMQFRVVRDALRRLLANQAAGAFTVIGLQKAGKSPEDVANGCLVEVFFQRSAFPKNAGAMAGPNRHDLTFQINLTVSKASVADVAVLEDPDATATQMAASLGDMKESGVLADDALDELFEVVYQIVMDARNMDLGLDDGIVSSRWISELIKEEPVAGGNYTVITGSVLFTCSVSEDVLGYRGTTVTPLIDVNLELNSDEPGLAGVTVGG
jgi:hypothetical protein